VLAVRRILLAASLICGLFSALGTRPAEAIPFFTGLGDLPGGVFDSTAVLRDNVISNDGLVVVGRGYSASGTEAFRWTQGGGMVGLGELGMNRYE
jgi:probable HAF family extracellular repeat protein